MTVTLDLIEEPEPSTTVVCADGTGTYRRRSFDGLWNQTGLPDVFTWRDVCNRIGATPCVIIRPYPPLVVGGFPKPEKETT